MENNNLIIVISVFTLLVALIGAIIGGWALYHDYQSSSESNTQYQNVSEDLKSIKEDISLLVPDKPQIKFSIHSQQNESYSFITGFYFSDACSYSELWKLKTDKEADRYDVLRVYIRNEGKKTYDLNLDIFCDSPNKKTNEDYLDGFLMAICPQSDIHFKEGKSDKDIVSITEIDKTTEYLAIFVYESISDKKVCNINYESKDIGGTEEITPFYD